METFLPAGLRVRYLRLKEKHERMDHGGTIRPEGFSQIIYSKDAYSRHIATFLP
jgi:hypothetical protein